VLPLTATVVVAAVFLVSPWKMVDPDALIRLAIGREILRGAAVPAVDPFTFSAPGVSWSNPEWLGDVIWYALFQGPGEPGMQIFKLTLLAAGFILALLLAVRSGASPPLAAAMLLLMLPGGVTRFTLRNQIHAFWLVPLYGVVLQRARRGLRWLGLLPPLAVLWANLHGSFPLGWLILLAWLAERALQRDLGPTRRLCWPVLVLAAHPLLALVSPLGLHNYGQLLDHLQGASVYRTLILEWIPPGEIHGPPLLAQLPLHLVALVGLASCLPRQNRREVGSLVLLSGGLLLGYSSGRFIALLAVLAVPGVAANLSRVVATTGPRFAKSTLVALGLLVLGAVVPVILSARNDPRSHVLLRPEAPLGAVQYLAREAPRGSRVLNPYNAGPWLLWGAGERIKLYIDPRNNLGAGVLRRYLQLLRAPATLEREVQHLGITHCLVDRAAPLMAPLLLHLGRSHPRWRLVYSDHRYRLYQRRIGR
jgi:hypothetical protein